MHGDFNKADSHIMAIIATKWEDFNKRVDSDWAIDDKAKWVFLQSQGVMVTYDPYCHPEKLSHVSWSGKPVCWYDL